MNIGKIETYSGMTNSNFAYIWVSNVEIFIAQDFRTAILMNSDRLGQIYGPLLLIIINADAVRLMELPFKLDLMST